MHCLSKPSTRNHSFYNIIEYQLKKGMSVFTHSIVEFYNLYNYRYMNYEVQNNYECFRREKFEVLGLIIMIIRYNF